MQSALRNEFFVTNLALQYLTVLEIFVDFRMASQTCSIREFFIANIADLLLVLVVDATMFFVRFLIA